MYRVRIGLLRWTATVAVALMVCALYVAPALAGGDDDAKLSHSAGTGITTFVGFGPVGKGIKCDPINFGPDCTFFTTSFTGSGKSEPGGPFTQTGTSTTFFGTNFGSITPNGAVLSSVGAPFGDCIPTFSTAHTVFANGTTDGNGTGNTCCAGTPPATLSGPSPCSFLGIGPPSTVHQSGVITSGTGKFAGIQCSGETTASSSDGVHVVFRGEAACTK